MDALAEVKPRPVAASNLLEVEDLHVHFETSRGIVRAVEGLSFEVARGEVVMVDDNRLGVTMTEIVKTDRMG